jgi:hypothetical protein
METNGYISPFIGDGYDESATIPAMPGKWSEVRLNYRCFSADEESEVYAKQKLFPAESAVAHFARLMATKIQGWDIKDREGKKLPVTAEAIKGLSPLFYDVLLQYVNGTLPSDQRKAHLEAEIKNS